MKKNDLITYVIGLSLATLLIVLDIYGIIKLVY